MAGIKTDPDPLFRIDPLPDPGEISDGRSHAVLLAAVFSRRASHSPPGIGKRRLMAAITAPARIGPGTTVVPEVGHEVGYPEESHRPSSR